MYITTKMSICRDEDQGVFDQLFSSSFGPSFVMRNVEMIGPLSSIH